jgi:hypothetical protein
MVVVSPVTAQPVVVTVRVDGEQVSVVDVEPSAVIEAVSQRTVTRSAVVVVDAVQVDEVDEVDEVESVCDVSLSSSSFNSSVEVVREVISPSTPSISLRLISSVMWVKSSPMHANALIALLMKSKRPLFLRFLELQGADDEVLPPRLEMMFSTSLLTFSTDFNVLSFRESGSDFQEFRIGMRAMISEETDETLDVARAPVTVVVTGGRVIGVSDPPTITGTVLVTPF